MLETLNYLKIYLKKQKILILSVMRESLHWVSTKFIFPLSVWKLFPNDPNSLTYKLSVTITGYNAVVFDEFLSLHLCIVSVFLTKQKTKITAEI